MELTQLLIIVLGNVAFISALCLWIRYMEKQLHDIRELARVMHAESIDFHNRLCAIEEKKGL